jgi:hypothetical protein
MDLSPHFSTGRYLILVVNLHPKLREQCVMEDLDQVDVIELEVQTKARRLLSLQKFGTQGRQVN